MALRLAIPAYALATVALAFEVWRFFLLATLLTFSGAEDLLLIFAFSLLVLSLGLVWFLCWVSVYSLLLNLLWSSPLKWLRLPKFSRLVNRDFGVLVTATLPIALVFFTQVGVKVSLTHHWPTARTIKLSYETFLLESFWLWFISAVFAYHGYDQISARARRRKQRKTLRST